MINPYADMINKIKAEVLALKTNRLRTATAISTTSMSRTFTIPWVYVPGPSPEYDMAYIEKYFYVDLDNNDPAFAVITFDNLNTIFSYQSAFSSVSWPPVNKGVGTQSLMIYSMDQTLVTQLRNGQTVNLTLTVTATATNFIDNIRMENT